MVALVLVSHSKTLATALRELALQMTQREVPIAIAAGVGDGHKDLGTDALQIADVLREMQRHDGILVLMDMGSAVLSAQTALEFLEPHETENIHLSDAPFVEGAVIAAVQASAGSSLGDVIRELDRALVAKREQIGPAVSNRTTAASKSLDPHRCAEIVLTVWNEHGLHARPAAALVEVASGFSSEIEITNLRSGAGPASARSLTSIALLQVGKGDTVRCRVQGDDQDAAIAALKDLATAGFGEGSQKSDDADSAFRVSRMVPASAGIAIGPLLRIADEVDPPIAGEAASPQAAAETLRTSLRRVIEDLNNSPSDGSTPANIRHTQVTMLSDPALLDKAESYILKHRMTASLAWARACDDIAASYEAMEDPYLRERGADLRDVKRMILRDLAGSVPSESFVPATPSILYVGEVLPSDAAKYDPTRVLGVIARRGSPTSHSAILLRAAGIPMVIGSDWIAPAEAGVLVAIDGSSGKAWARPSEPVLDQLRTLQQQRAARSELAESTKAQPVITLDGVSVEIMANVSSREDTESAISNHASGIGLLRTELLFASLKALKEEEQVRLLHEAIGAMDGPVLVRTLDVGGDKPLPSLPCEPEGNPFLGVRGIRLTLRNLSFFRTHLRAILRAGESADLWIMFPMVASLAEVRRTREMIASAHETLTSEGVPHAWPVKLGCMIEVPSAALTIAHLAHHLDFFSIGTNDLTQYTMAAERGNAALSEYQDALHPAVLQLIDDVVRGASGLRRHVSICGEAASDPVASAVFLGLGIRSLSVSPRLIPEVKALVRGLKLADLEAGSAQALKCADAAEVRAIFGQILDEMEKQWVSADQ